MKKTILGVLMLVLTISLVSVFSLTGCKEEVEESTEDIVEETTGEAVEEAVEESLPDTVTVGDYELKIPKKDPKDIEIVALYLDVTHPFAAKLNEGVEAAAKDFGVNGYQTGSDNWGSEDQVALFETLLAKPVDGISVAALDPPPVDPFILEGLEAGIPITTYNVDSAESPRLSYTGQNLFESGKATAEAIVESMGEKGKVVITGAGIELFVSLERERGIYAVLDNYPDIEVVGPVDCSGDEATAYGIIESTYLANQDMDAVIDLGAVQYIWGRFFKNENIGNINSDNPIYCSGHDIYEEKLIQIQEGWLTITFGQNPYEQGYQAIAQIAKFLTTADPNVFETIGTPLIPADINNAGELLEDLRNGAPIG